MPVTAGEFRSAMGRFAAGVTVVTVRDPACGDRGMTASAVCSVSLDPPLLLVCVKKGKRTDAVLQDGDAFALNLLSEDQVLLSNRFAGYGDAPTDDLSDLDIDRAPLSGAAWFPGALARIDCAVHGILDGGDHHIYLGRLEAVDLPGDRDDLRPLLYFAGAYRTAGDRL
ncbi:MAG: flavin reductase family protein [Oligoflexia bacterium]|nr:flavin reductase family protein [Oligoflexia bacterium]